MHEISGAAPTASKLGFGGQDEANWAPKRIARHGDLGGHAALEAAHGLARSPLSRLPTALSVTTGALTLACSMSGSYKHASKSRRATPAYTQPRKRVRVALYLPNADDVQARLHQQPVVRPLRLGSLRWRRQSGPILAHRASVKTDRSARNSDHEAAGMEILKPKQVQGHRAKLGLVDDPLLQQAKTRHSIQSNQPTSAFRLRKIRLHQPVTSYRTTRPARS